MKRKRYIEQYISDNVNTFKVTFCNVRIFLLKYIYRFNTATLLCLSQAMSLSFCIQLFEVRIERWLFAWLILVELLTMHDFKLYFHNHHHWYEVLLPRSYDSLFYVYLSNQWQSTPIIYIEIHLIVLHTRYNSM